MEQVRLSHASWLAIILAVGITAILLVTGCGEEQKPAPQEAPRVESSSDASDATHMMDSAVDTVLEYAETLGYDIKGVGGDVATGGTAPEEIADGRIMDASGDVSLDFEWTAGYPPHDAFVEFCDKVANFVFDRFPDENVVTVFVNEERGSTFAARTYRIEDAAVKCVSETWNFPEK